MERIKTILMRRDGMTESEATELIMEANADFHERIENGDMTAEDICMEYFGLEPDYIYQIM